MNFKNLFLRQSYLDSYETYASVLSSAARKPALWDYCILTASNESQAESYRKQIEYRRRHRVLPEETHFAVIPDYEGKRIGSGGATLSVMKYIKDREGSFDGLKILVIHSGGDSKRVPQYSACGKLFSPVPRLLPDGRRSTLFDEFMIGMSGVPSRIGAGMLVLSGDVLLLFNPLQIDFFGSGAAAFSMKEDVKTGKNHGVFLRNGSGNVDKFLHKQTEETLNLMGAIDQNGKVNIDTGAICFGSDILNDLSCLIDTQEGFDKYVNDKVRLSFYADFVYPLAENATLEDFYNEKPEGEFSDELKDARTVLWNILHKYRMKLICLSPASFLHFGTSTELLSLVTEKIDDYKFLDWSNTVNTNRPSKEYAVYNSYISKSATIQKGCYIENSTVDAGTVVGKGCIISGVTLENANIPENTLLHGLKLKNGKFVVRMLSINDNPKENIWMGNTLSTPLWDAPLFAAFDSMKEAALATLQGVKGDYSLKSSFNEADVTQILPWEDKLDDKIRVERILDSISNLTPLSEIDGSLITPRVRKYLIRIAEKSGFSLKLRIYFYLGKLLGDENLIFKSFDIIRETLLSNLSEDNTVKDALHIAKDEVTARLPIRVNWGGGWSDTPPYCMENGGTVLNAAVLLNNEKPIAVTVKRLKENKIILTSTDNGSYKEFTDICELTSCSNPHDPFALHKAALIACGIIPQNGETDLSTLCKDMGGGIYLNTRVEGIPKGSGLGTSSILAAACVKAIYEFFGKKADERAMYSKVVCMEQLMSTGGGWQDQIGGMLPGIKMLTSAADLQQKINVRKLNIPENILEELKERFCLIYTGQRRLARNLLREVVGKYIGGDPTAIEVLDKIQDVAQNMAISLEGGNLDKFCRLLNEHWELSKKLDAGCTNTCIDQIFTSIDELIDAKMICGAGGGGFLQVILKKGVTKNQLKEQLFEIFSDSGVEVYDCEFYM